MPYVFCIFEMYNTGWAKSRRALDCYFTFMAEILGGYWGAPTSNGWAGHHCPPAGDGPGYWLRGVGEVRPAGALFRGPTATVGLRQKNRPATTLRHQGGEEFSERGTIFQLCSIVLKLVWPKAEVFNLWAMAQ